MRTLLLELTPERDAERETIAKIRLWIDQGSWMPRRQEFSAADRTVTTVDYTAVARNLRLNPDLFKDSWPRGTKKVKN
jgi:outer membrane lipoprotein-sorting protein